MTVGRAEVRTAVLAQLTPLTIPVPPATEPVLKSAWGVPQDLVRTPLLPTATVHIEHMQERRHDLGTKIRRYRILLIVDTAWTEKAAEAQATMDGIVDAIETQLRATRQLAANIFNMASEPGATLETTTPLPTVAETGKLRLFSAVVAFYVEEAVTG